MLHHFDINTCIVTTVSAVRNTLSRRATLRLQLVRYNDGVKYKNVYKIIIVKVWFSFLFCDLSVYPLVAIHCSVHDSSCSVLLSFLVVALTALLRLLSIRTVK